MLTKSDLSAIKKLIDDGFHQNISEYHTALVKPEFDAIDKRFETIDKRFDQIEKKIDQLDHKVDTHYTWLKNDIRGLETDFSLSVSKSEFNQLKTQVNKYCPAI